jgi:hypothetical protein
MHHSIEMEAEKLLNLIKTRYPDRLSDKQWRQVREGIVSNQQAVEAIRRVKLDAADEPAALFKPYRSDEL